MRRIRLAQDNLLLIQQILRRMADDPCGNLDERRMVFLQRCQYALGPTQLEHVTSHADQVSETAVGLARLMRMNGQQIYRVQDAALLHDIGKCVIPEQLLAKPGALTTPQWQLMAIHPQLGAWISSHLGADDQIVAMIRHHHTRYDHHGVVGDPTRRPPLGARVLCVADAFVTMTTSRTYQPARAIGEALMELNRQRGAQFDPQVVDAAHHLGPSLVDRAA